MDFPIICENIVSTLSEYLIENKLKAMIIGLSGGLDSTVSSALCHLVSKRTGIPLIGYSLPCSTNKEDENNSASLAGKEFCDEFHIINIQDTFECVENACTIASGIESTPISQGNIKARLRMIMLYDIASKLGGIVIDNDNLSERWLGFYTINGDVFDISPIASLWKSEIYDFARWLKDYIIEYHDSKALEAAINITPTDGNGVSNSDLDQIMPGYTYQDVDNILIAWTSSTDMQKENYFEDIHSPQFDFLNGKYGKDNVKRVIMRSVNTEYKRYPHPIVIDAFEGKILKNE